ncbi:MAG: aryl-alcohol dehydrogenase [Betaproteobacteria bacterium]|nr:aryl-alcohol dehydrogenase [Betaproteobacteria bacterium]
MSKLGLGTVQWGMDYGVSNQGGRTQVEMVSAILCEAPGRGVDVLDTAALYGDAESVLGRNALARFRVITKTPRFAASTITQGHALELDAVFHRSLERLSSPAVYGLLAHHADDLLAPGGEKLWQAMSLLKDQGLVEKIGASIYDGDQVDALLERFRPDIVQAPLSVLDQRMLLNGQLERLHVRGVEVHTRSAFLQGLLLLPPDRIPVYFDPIAPLLKRWHAAVKEQGITPTQAALAFVRDVPYVDTVLIGVESVAQFRGCVLAFESAARFDAAELACNDPMFVNPVNWKH